MVKKIFWFVILISMTACSQHEYHTVKVHKPINHKSWYKDHRYRKNIRIGRFRFDIFDRQGTKVVKMKG